MLLHGVSLPYYINHRSSIRQDSFLAKSCVTDRWENFLGLAENGLNDWSMTQNLTKIKPLPNTVFPREVGQWPMWYQSNWRWILWNGFLSQNQVIVKQRSSTIRFVLDYQGAVVYLWYAVLKHFLFHCVFLVHIIIIFVNHFNSASILFITI